MARASKKDAERHRQEIVTAAARLFRERGIGGVSVPEVTAAAGLTHGGFYGHFASKNALAAEAIDKAGCEIAEFLSATIAPYADDRQAATAALVGTYLSRDHRDHPERGCATAALIDYGRDASCPELTAAYRAGVERMIAAIEAALPPGSDRADALAALSTMVGGLLLARATAGAPLSDEVLAAARHALGVAPETANAATKIT